MQLFEKHMDKYKHSTIGKKQFQYNLGPKKLKHFCEHYGENNNHMINSLSMIGWSDLRGPKETPEEDREATKAPHDEFFHHAYPKYKYVSKLIPLSIFKPTDEVLIKIIRASIGIKKESQFVFNKVNIE